MPSLRARFVNRLLRMTTKPLWRPGLDIHQVREHTARMEARLVRRAPSIATEAVTVAGVPPSQTSAPFWNPDPRIVTVVPVFNFRAVGGGIRRYPPLRISASNSYAGYCFSTLCRIILDATHGHE